MVQAWFNYQWKPIKGSVSKYCALDKVARVSQELVSCFWHICSLRSHPKAPWAHSMHLASSALFDSWRFIHNPHLNSDWNMQPVLCGWSVTETLQSTEDHILPKLNLILLCSRNTCCVKCFPSVKLLRTCCAWVPCWVSVTSEGLYASVYMQQEQASFCHTAWTTVVPNAETLQVLLCSARAQPEHT